MWSFSVNFYFHWAALQKWSPYKCFISQQPVHYRTIISILARAPKYYPPQKISCGTCLQSVMNNDPLPTLHPLHSFICVVCGDNVVFCCCRLIRPRIGQEWWPRISITHSKLLTATYSLNSLCYFPLSGAMMQSACSASSLWVIVKLSFGVYSDLFVCGGRNCANWLKTCSRSTHAGDKRLENFGRATVRKLRVIVS